MQCLTDCSDPYSLSVCILYVFARSNAGIAKLHLARHSASNEGFTWAKELTWSTKIWMAASSSPSVALRADIGSFQKKAKEMVTVPGSDVGKVAMNFAGVHWRFWLKCMRPAHTNMMWHSVPGEAHGTCIFVNVWTFTATKASLSASSASDFSKLAEDTHSRQVHVIWHASACLQSQELQARLHSHRVLLSPG